VIAVVMDRDGTRWFWYPNLVDQAWPGSDWSAPPDRSRRGSSSGKTRRSQTRPVSGIPASRDSSARAETTLVTTGRHEQRGRVTAQAERRSNPSSPTEIFKTGRPRKEQGAGRMISGERPPNAAGPRSTGQ